MKKIDDYISVKQASDLLQKSQASIRRICKKNEGTPFVKKESGKLWLSKAFILEEYSAENGSQNQKEDDFPFEQNEKSSKNLYLEELLKERDLFEQLNDKLSKESQRQTEEIDFLQSRLANRTNEAKESLKSLNSNKEDELANLQRRLEEQENILSSIEKQKKSLQKSLAQKDTLLKELEVKTSKQNSKSEAKPTEIKIDLSKILFGFLGIAAVLVLIYWYSA